ncbi:cation channel sperm-associated protein 3-like [Pygocentrus nattereri]|uniref:cation channel sperm-associated protein 3-like n=1 Tax=Pygocentrus nattereri TaxID=42514 RepID=UPI001891EDE2|nr:cation channel sperm-associated protein 3-like [Pygocentrus nattereri]
MGHFIFFNMFVGLVIMEVERMTKAREEEALQEREAAKKGAKKKRTMKQLIGSQKWSDTNIKTDENFHRIIQQLRTSLSDSDHIVTKDKSSSLTFLQNYLTTLQHQDTTLDK